MDLRVYWYSKAVNRNATDEQCATLLPSHDESREFSGRSGWVGDCGLVIREDTLRAAVDKRQFCDTDRSHYGMFMPFFSVLLWAMVKCGIRKICDGYFAEWWCGIGLVLGLVNCIVQLDQWMSKNRLKLNADKTQLIWLGSRQQLAKLTVTQLRLTSSVVEFDTSVTYLGVVLDNRLSMQAQVAAVCRSCFYQLRQLRVVQRSLTRDVLQSLVSGFYPLSSGLLQCDSDWSIGGPD